MAQVADPSAGASGAETGQAAGAESGQSDPMVGQPVLQSPVAPVPDSAPAETAPSPEPAIVLPSQQAPEPSGETSPPPRVVSDPVVQQVEPSPVPEPVDEAPAAAEPEAAAAAPAPVAEPEPAAEPPAEAAPIAEPAPAEGEATAAIAPPPALVSAPAETDLAETDPAEAVDPENVAAIGYAGMIVSALAIIGLFLLAAFAFRRRRKPVPTVERPVVTPRAEAAPEKEPERDPRPATVDTPAPVSDIRDWAQPAPVAPAAQHSQLREGDGSGGLAHAGAAVALPRRAPENFEERDRLLRRMVEARPDRANPFTSRKARRRRARLILQSLGRTFENGSRIDLSQYPANWPELARSDYPTAA